MDKVPGYCLKDENGEPLMSSLISGMRYIMCLVPDASEESKAELAELNNIYQKLMVRNIPILVVMPLPPTELRSIVNELGIKLKLLSDADGKFAAQCGLTPRATFIAGKDDVVEACWENVQPKGHAMAVFEKTMAILKDPSFVDPGF